MLGVRRKIANKLRKAGEWMTEKYIGKARHYKRGNELFWKYRDIVLDDYGNIVLDDDGSLVWLNLRWTGYNDRVVVVDNEGCDTMTLGQDVKATFSSIQAKFSSEDATEWLSNWGHSTCRQDNVIYLNCI